MKYRYGRDDDSGDFAWFTTDEVEDNRIHWGNNILRTITSYEDDFDSLHVGRYVCGLAPHPWSMPLQKASPLTRQQRSIVPRFEPRPGQLG